MRSESQPHKKAEERGKHFEYLFEQALVRLVNDGVIDEWTASVKDSPGDRSGIDYYLWSQEEVILWQITSNAKRAWAHRRKHPEIKSGKIGMTLLMKGKVEKTVDEVVEELGQELKNRLGHLRGNIEK